MTSSLKLGLGFCLLLAGMPSPAVAAEDLTAKQLVDRVLANKARYLTLTATVEKTLSEKSGSGEWIPKSKTEITCRQRAAGDAWFLQLVEQPEGRATNVRRYAKREDCLKMFENAGEEGGAGKVISLANHSDRHMGYLTPDAVLWDPLNYSWDAYIKGAQKLVREEGIYYLTSSVVGGRATITIAVDPDHGYLPILYEKESKRLGRVSVRYSASDLREVNGLWLPFRYEMVSLQPDGRGVWAEFEVKEITANQPIPDEQLDVRFPPGTQVSYETKRLKLRMALNRLGWSLSPSVVVSGLLFVAVAIAALLAILRHAKGKAEDR